MKPKLLVIGQGRHGKDTAAEYLEANYGYTFSSSSYFVAEQALWPEWGRHHYPSFEAMFADRVNHRELWSEMIFAYNTPDRARTAREMIVDLGLDLYVGMRDARELEAAKAERIFDYIIWVDASKRLPPELNRHMTVTESMADFTVDNNSTLEAFHSSLDSLMETIL